MTTPTSQPTHRWYHLTPDRFFIGLLVMQVFLLLSERFQWFAFNEHKGWTVLIAVGVVGCAVLVMLLWGLVCLCLRRRFQFSSRSLLLFVVTVSVPLGWFAWEMQKARRQREAVEKIVKADGSVEYDYQPEPTLANLFEPRPKTPPQPTTPAWLRKLLGDDFFCEVVRVNCRFREYGDDDARHLKELTELRELWLDQTEITDDGLAHLAGMTQLQWLSLGDTQITDNGLAHLKGMTKLASLRLDHTEVTDAGLEYLTGLNNLYWLDLRGTQVTDDGVKTLQQALPNCEIDR